PGRMATVLHVALQVVDDAKTMLTPFLPSSSTKVHTMLRGGDQWAAMPDLVEVDEPTAAGSPSYAVLTGDYDTGARWESTPLEVGRPLSAPKPVFAKLDPSVVDEGLARLSGDGPTGPPGGGTRRGDRRSGAKTEGGRVRRAYASRRDGVARRTRSGRELRGGRDARCA